MKKKLIPLLLTIPLFLGGWTTDSQKIAAYYYYYMNNQSSNNTTSPEAKNNMQEYYVDDTGNVVVVETDTNDNTTTTIVGNINDASNFSNISTTYNAVFSSAGTTGYGMDMMKLIAMADPTSNYAKLNKELLELYVMASKGELDTASFHLEPGAYAAKHRNETSTATFLDTYYLYDANHTLSKWGKNNKISNLEYGNTSINKDNGNDNEPDGPFQFENTRDKPSSQKSTLNPTGTTSDRKVDTYFFPDQLSMVNHSSSDIANTYSISKEDAHLVNMYSSAKHNRGSFHKQAWGIPYDATGTRVNFAKYVSTGISSAESKEQINASFNSLYNTYKRLQPTITKTDNTSMRSIAVYLALNDGWYIDQTLDSTLETVINSNLYLFTSMVPAGYSGSTMQYIRDNYVKAPWDIVGITEAQYGKIYGTENGNSYYNCYSHRSLFKVENYTSSYYINKMPDGSNPPVVHVWDNVVLGHVVGSSIFGDYILLELLVKAGLSDIDGVPIDASDPSILYSALQEADSNTYMPIPVTNTSSDFETLIDMLDISTTSERLLSLYYTYEQMGTKYYYGGGGLEVATENYSSHKNWASSNSTSKTSHNGQNYLDSVFYNTTEGKSYYSGVSNSNLANYGVRLFDCAKLAMAGPSLGRTKGSALYYSQNSNGIISVGASAGFHDYYELNGVEYDTGFRKVSDGAYSMSYYKSNASDVVPGGLQPGDILATSGHAFTVLCVASKNVTIPSNIAQSGTDVNISAGSLVSLEAWESGEYNRVRDKGWTDSRSYSVYRPYMFG